MILRFGARSTEPDEFVDRGFDSFDLRLGDLMRGERATLGKSLLDVERELRIKASFVAAIENADPDAFDTPGFIPGYVRSYARYLGMSPDEAFARFCAESGFEPAHGMSAAASSKRQTGDPFSENGPRRNDDPLVAPVTPFLPASEGVLSRIEPGAVGSLAVLIALVGAIGYGGWTVLNQVQKVTVAPVENTPEVLAELDPLQSAMQTAVTGAGEDTVAGVFSAPEEDALDRLYRPEALDVPVLVARDAPISTLSPNHIGTLVTVPADTTRQVAVDGAEAGGSEGLSGIEAALAQAIGPQVLADPKPGVQMVAVRPAWVRVTSADGSVIFEAIMNAGDSYDVPVMETPPSLMVGESGAIYFAVDGQHYGPVGPRGSVTKGVALAAGTISETYAVADLAADADLERYVAELNTQAQQ